MVDIKRSLIDITSFKNQTLLPGCGITGKEILEINPKKDLLKTLVGLEKDSTKAGLGYTIAFSGILLAVGAVTIATGGVALAPLGCLAVGSTGFAGLGFLNHKLKLGCVEVVEQTKYIKEKIDDVVKVVEQIESGEISNELLKELSPQDVAELQWVVKKDISTLMSSDSKARLVNTPEAESHGLQSELGKSTPPTTPPLGR